MPRASLTEPEMFRIRAAAEVAGDAYGLDMLPAEDIGAAGSELVGAETPAEAQAAIGLEPGVDVQEFSSILDLLAALALAGNALKVIRVNAGATAFELAAAAGGGGGLSDGDYGDVSVSAGGTVLTIDAGAVTLAKQADMATASVVYRKTAGAGAPEVQTLATLKTDLGLTGTNSGDQSLAAYALLASPALTGTPTAPTAAPGTNTTQLANTAFVAAAVAALIAAAPGALDTLDELAAAMGDDANFATTVTNALALKQPLDADLTAIAALATTAYGRGFLDLADAPAGRTKLALGSAALNATGDFQPADADLTSIAALATTAFGRSHLVLADAAAGTAQLNVFTALLKGLVPASGGGTTNFLRADGAFAAPTASVGFAQVEADLGSTPRYSGKFTIAGAGLTIGKPVYIQQAIGPYTGKGTLADEAEMDQLNLSAAVASAVAIDVYWTSRFKAAGNFKFNYLVGA